ncbi:MAG: phosphate regulon sensor protein PhoR [Adhaeribacter sp.]|nr:phosphate regulon sensor protein PhoR [Adhaeribacter sp.]
MNLSENQESLHILEQIAEQTDQVFFIVDIKANSIKYLNPTFDQIWNRKRQDIMQQPATLLETIHPDDREFVLQFVDRVVNREQQSAGFRIIADDHTVKSILVKVYYINNANGSLSLAGFADDVTATTEKYQTLLKYSERKNSILHSFSHELAGPIALIQNLTALLGTPNNKPEAAQEIISYIQQTCNKSMALIKELLNNEFLESANATLHKNRFDLLAKCRNIVTMFRQAEINSRKIIKLVSSHDPLFINADDVMLMQVIHNLISNSKKFTHEGGTITITLLERVDSVLITVKDDGIGIPQDLQPFVFDKFTTARRRGLRGEDTVGLGMSIIKNIVDLHQGQIWLTSEENKGTTVFIQLPK